MISDEQQKHAIHALKRGEMRALETLVQCHQLQAVRVAYGVVGHRQTAEDAVADAFLLVYERITQYDEARPLVPWFYRIVVNCALKAVRGQERVGPPDDENTWQSHPSTLLSPEDSAEQGELRTTLISMVYDLPPPQRAAVVLKYYLDMDEAGIAEALNCPVGTVKWRLHAAKAKLKEKLLPLIDD